MSCTKRHLRPPTPRPGPRGLWTRSCVLAGRRLLLGGPGEEEEAEAQLLVEDLELFCVGAGREPEWTWQQSTGR